MTKISTEDKHLVKRLSGALKELSVKTRICLLFQLFRMCSDQKLLTLEQCAFGKGEITQQELSNKPSRTSLFFPLWEGGHQLSKGRWNENAKDRDGIWHACYWPGGKRHVSWWTCTEKSVFFFVGRASWWKRSQGERWRDVHAKSGVALHFGRFARASWAKSRMPPTKK